MSAEGVGHLAHDFPSLRYISVLLITRTRNGVAGRGSCRTLFSGTYRSFTDQNKAHCGASEFMLGLGLTPTEAATRGSSNFTLASSINSVATSSSLAGSSR
jgi:hypothetical protein